MTGKSIKIWNRTDVDAWDAVDNGAKSTGIITLVISNVSKQIGFGMFISLVINEAYDD